MMKLSKYVFVRYFKEQGDIGVYLIPFYRVDQFVQDGRE